MANIVRIELKSEQNVLIVGETLQPELKPRISAYITCDSMSAWIGVVETYEELLELAGPENLEEEMEYALSGDEIEVIDAALECSDYEYMIGDKWFTMIQY